jgi:gluconokinase
MVVIIMGAAGAGKTTIGRLVAEQLGCPFLDADAFHPASNVAKMHHGVPLTDADRWPWLDATAAALRDLEARGTSAVLACSALKEIYRARLSAGLRDVRVVYLKADAALLRSRVQARRGHFMPGALVESQLADLEEPDTAITIDASEKPDTIVRTIVSRLAA